MNIGIKMSFNKIINSIHKAFLVSGYSRTAKELYLLSDRQLEDLGISRALLKRGYAGYPWRVEAVVAQEIPDNVSQLKVTKSATASVNQTPIMPQKPKAA